MLPVPVDPAAVPLAPVTMAWALTTAMAVPAESAEPRAVEVRERVLTETVALAVAVTTADVGLQTVETAVSVTAPSDNQVLAVAVSVAAVAAPRRKPAVELAEVSEQPERSTPHRACRQARPDRYNSPTPQPPHLGTQHSS